MYALNYIQIGVIKINIFTIEYDGILSCDFGLHLATVDNDGFEVESGVDPEVISAEIPRYEGKLIYGVKQNGEFEFPLSLMSEKTIDFESMKKIKDWLFHHNKPCKFRFIGEGYSDWFYYAFISYDKDYVDGDGVRGIKFKVKSISPYAYGEIRLHEYDLTNQLTEFSDANGVKYKFAKNISITVPNVETANVYGVKPIITITSIIPPTQEAFDARKKANGNVAVYNSVTNATSQETLESIWYDVRDIADYGASYPTIIKVDCHKGIIKASSGNSELNFYENFQEGMRSAIMTGSGSTISTFPSLTKGDNKFVVYGFIQSIKIEYIPSIRLGAW